MQYLGFKHELINSQANQNLLVNENILVCKHCSGMD